MTIAVNIQVRPDRTTRAYQDFLLGAKLFWTRRLYNELYALYREKVEEQGGTIPQSFEEAEALLDKNDLYQFFGWLERHIQRLKYSGPFGIVRTVDKQRNELIQALEEATREAGPYLRLNPDLEIPRYFSEVDYHQHPGGVGGDELAGFAYEYGRKTTTPNHIHENDLYYRLAAATPKGNFKRILDFGCGIGPGSYPFKEMYPDAEVYGIDVAAPCLKVAHLRAKEKGYEVFFSQQNFEHTDFPDNYFDLIHTVFIQHELPKKALRNAAAEAFRILQPGGYFVNLDFHDAPGGAFGKLLHYGHAKRNNEVFMRSFDQIDYTAMLREVGFDPVEMRPFDDGTGLISDPNTVPQNWRFPWQLFVAQKPL
jgi:SAM-dependent methyltransferase